MAQLLLFTTYKLAMGSFQSRPAQLSKFFIIQQLRVLSDVILENYGENDSDE